MLSLLRQSPLVSFHEHVVLVEGAEAPYGVERALLTLLVHFRVLHALISWTVWLLVSNVLLG